MRRHNVRLGLMILDILMMLPLTGCKFWKVRDTIECTEDGFEYALAKYTNGRVETDPSKGFVTITKLADPDENGRLDIPRTIAGFPVKYLGRSANDMDYAEDRPIYFPSTLKKLFVFETLEGIDNVQNPGKVSPAAMRSRYGRLGFRILSFYTLRMCSGQLSAGAASAGYAFTPWRGLQRPPGRMRGLNRPKRSGEPKRSEVRAVKAAWLPRTRAQFRQGEMD